MKDLRVRELLVCVCLYACKNVRHVCMYVRMYVCVRVVWPHTKHASCHEKRRAA